MKQETGNGCLKPAEAPFFTAGLKNCCKYTHVNEMKRCAGTQAKCI